MVHAQPSIILENETHKLLWSFDIQTDHLISARRPDLIIINKKRTCKIVDFDVSADHRVKLKESEKKDKYLDLARELKKLWNMKVTFIPIVISALSIVTEGLLKGLEDLEIRGRVEIIIKLLHYWDWPKYWDLRRFAVTQTPVENHQLMLVWKTFKWVK